MQRIVVSLAIFVALLLVPATSFAQIQSTQSLNQQMAQSIADKLSDKYPEYTINVRYNGGIATLVGELYTQEQVNDAAQYVQTLPGVNKVINNLKIVQQQTRIQEIPVASRLGNRPIPAETSAPQAAVSQPVSSNVITQVSATTQVSAAPVNGTMAAVTDFTTQPIPQAPLTAPSLNTVPLNVAPSAPPVPVPTLNSTSTMQASYVGSPQEGDYLPPAISDYPMPFGAPVGGNAFMGNGYGQMQSQETINTGVPMYAGNAPSPYVSANGNMPLPMGSTTQPAGRYDRPNVPPYAWPAYTPPNNTSQVGYPRLYCPDAAPYIGPFYPYPQPPLEWRKVTLEWHDGYWWLDFDDGSCKGPFSPLFRAPIPKR